MKSNPTYLCHKCGGALTGRDPHLHGCGCISGWVRDWQEPTTDAYREQGLQCLQWALHHEAQGQLETAEREFQRAFELEALANA